MAGIRRSTTKPAGGSRRAVTAVKGRPGFMSCPRGPNPRQLAGPDAARALSMDSDKIKVSKTIAVWIEYVSVVIALGA